MMEGMNLFCFVLAMGVFGFILGSVYESRKYRPSSLKLIAKVPLRDGATLIFKAEQHLSLVGKDNIKKVIVEFFGDDRKVIVISHDLEMEILQGEVKA